jgi:hypothetical protein
MIKDIFIDAQIANKFASTTDKSFKELIDWLLSNNEEDRTQNAYLIVSNYLRKEYLGGNQNTQNQFSISNIYAKLMAQDRIITKTNKEIDEFMKKWFSKSIWGCGMNCKKGGSDDPKHIALILLSERRIAIIDDHDFITDLINFPLRGIKGRTVKASRSPEGFDYKENEAA